MSARETILKAIAAGKPALKNLPVVDLSKVTNYDNLVEKFTNTLTGIGGIVEELNNIDDLQTEIDAERKQGKFILNTITETASGTMRTIIDENARTLEPLHKAYIKASLGVAENGAVWISETQMVNRLLPFICQHLVVVLEKNKFVATMHQAYQQVNSFEEGFGVFIAGPSKTADIEQSLVIGAHGARSMTILLVN